MHVLTEKQALWHKSYHLQSSRSLPKLYKAKTNKKESGLINKKKKQVSPSFKKQHSLIIASHAGVFRGARFSSLPTNKNERTLLKTPAFIMKPLHLALKHSCPKIITVYQVVKVRLKWYKIDSNDK